ncbi:phosphotransferase [Salinisphaera orenii MK-B5]|uniref:Putative phosphoenolpyruvate synthase regulatory protein n=1 Tax=Salinisphaera orenii MK-B5 TaxID=856730 RepID=A0A423PTU5_9GAMM|nr:pyruvate, water dikinase regulatory protein [Salinisphaera orenii]ROO29013.1 phosphotransferase [Salinisphaera orenii MK-B5]
MSDADTPQRSIFFLSDRTGITAETLGATLLTQFDERSFRQSTLPFINTPEKARSALEYIEHTGRASGLQPIVFSTTVSEDVREILRDSSALFLDLFDTFVPKLERALETKSEHREGRAHGIADEATYRSRIDAMNYALTHDDGVGESGYDQAQVILVAPSRCGKTPVCIYLAMQHGVYAANYPLTDEDLEGTGLPRALKPYRDKLYGLWIDPERLHHIRSERRRGSSYAALPQVSYELRQAEGLYKRHGLPYAETTNKSIEEIATLIMQDKDIRRRSF